MARPVHVRIEYRERRSRLTTAFRLPLVVPHLVVGAVLSVAASAAVAAAWCAILLTGRSPRPLVRFVPGTIRYATRVGCYWMLVTDPFPAFRLRAGEEDDDAVAVSIDEPERRSRLSVLARLPLALPAWLVAYFLGLFALMMAFAAWWVILVTGRLPHSMFEVMELPHRYQARVLASTWLLVDDYARFQEEGGSAARRLGYPARGSALPLKEFGRMGRRGTCLYSCDPRPSRGCAPRSRWLRRPRPRRRRPAPGPR